MVALFHAIKNYYSWQQPFNFYAQKQGKSVAGCISDRIDYALNPDKTNNGKYVSSYEWT